uniref:RxLR effector protein n=1 Tax=Phytophthora ramorum TaxID=164328 RepID=H3GXN8_PHYRM
MRLHFVVLLAAAVLLASVEALADSTLTMTRSVTAGRDAISAERFLRTEPTADVNGEERIFKVPSRLTNLFKPGTSSKVTSEAKVASKVITPSVASNIAKEAPNPRAWLDAEKSVDDVFLALKLDKVDDLIANANFMTWFGYVTQYNQKFGNKATTVVKSLTTRYGDQKLAEMLITAAKSKDPRVKSLGKGLLKGQMDDWFKKGDKPAALAKTFGLTKTNSAEDKNALIMSVLNLYNTHYDKAVAKAIKKAEEAAAAKAAETAKGIAAAAAR